MHDGCSGSFTTAEQTIEKVRRMGFASQPLPAPLTLACPACSAAGEMRFFEDRCEKCGATMAVTPCHSHDPAAVVALRE
ncbi:MAG: hypothetical protein ACQEQV_08435 [Fibrobacterota bacterium]